MKTQDNRDRIAAIYVRLSEEDHDKVHETDDSLSIQNQKSMLLEFASKHGWNEFSRCTLKETVEQTSPAS